jgi:hypothetical protein
VNVSQKNTVASVLARLKNVAQEEGLSFNDVLQTYVNERFLARIDQSRQAKGLLLKGAQMLRVWGITRSRPTMDIDLLRRGVADEKSLIELVRSCATTVDPTDGVTFDASSIVAESIREETSYVGTRIRLQARLDNVRQTVQIDFGTGDAVHPAPLKIEFPLLLGGTPIRLDGYPAEASIAEKFHAMVQLDQRNSRMKDFYDVWILSETLEFSSDALGRAIFETFERRRTQMPAAIPAAFTATFYEDASHMKQWSAFAKRIGEAGLASEFSRIVRQVGEFLAPAATAEAIQAHQVLRWKPKGPWSPHKDRQ